MRRPRLARTSWASSSETTLGPPSLNEAPTHVRAVSVCVCVYDLWAMHALLPASSLHSSDTQRQKCHLRASIPALATLVEFSCRRVRVRCTKQAGITVTRCRWHVHDACESWRSLLRTARLASMMHVHALRRTRFGHVQSLRCAAFTPLPSSALTCDTTPSSARFVPPTRSRPPFLYTYCVKPHRFIAAIE